jgi:NADH:ubiquinone reductase (H+-translocating)
MQSIFILICIGTGTNEDIRNNESQHKGEITMKNLVILGGGYGGMRVLARLLPNQLPDDVTITLVDKVPYHCLKTEYYALAAGTISDQDVRVAFPEHSRLNVLYGEIEKIDVVERKVHVSEQTPITYDDLIVGLGCEDNYHNVPGAAEFTYSIQSIEKSRRTYETLNNLVPGSIVAIVGAGLSGVELASELNESRPDLKVKLFDRGNYILSTFPKRLSTYVENWFDNHGVEIVNNSNITRVEENILYNHDEPVKCDAIVWTAGIQPNRVVREMEVEKDKQGRIVLTKHHNIPNDEHVYVVGDCASLPHAPSAQLAEGQAEQIVQILLKRWNGEPLPETLPTIKLKGVLGSLGKKHGFGLLGEKPVTGRVARLLKSGILWMYKHHNG